MKNNIKDSEFLESLRWPQGVICCFCHSDSPYKMRDRGRGVNTYRCSNPLCKKDFTVTVGTIFENSKINLSTWINIIQETTTSTDKISSYKIALKFGLTQKSAYLIMKKINTILSI